MTEDRESPDYRHLSEWASIRILNAIREGSIKQGERLVEREIADRLNISRAPVRDAFHRLESIGVVERMHPRGISVRAWTDHDAVEILYLMDALIFLSVKLAVGRLTEEDFAKLDEILLETGRNAAAEAVDRSRQLGLDVEFHQIIARATGHKRLIEQLEQLVLPLDLWPKVFMRRILPDFSFRQHTELVAALRSGDRQAAVECVVRHQQETEALELVVFGSADQEGREPVHPDLAPPTAHAAPDPSPKRSAARKSRQDANS